MKIIYALFFFAISCLTAQGQSTGSVHGTVKTSDGNPAAYVNVSIKGTTKGAVAGKDGEFEIRNVPAGSHIVVASFVGLENRELSVEVKAGQSTVADFVLNENALQLQEVIISGRTNLNKEESYVAKMPMKKMENPQVYNSVSSEILKQQAVTSYDDALRNVPGVFRTWESTGRDGDGTAYYALRGLEGQPALVNGLPGITNGNLDLANVEEIQVMKGPSATLFGANATAYPTYGGVINTVTKKPYFTTGGEIVYNIGSFGLSRFTADVNVPLSKTEKIAVRVNGAYHSEGSFQDAGFRKAMFLAPSLAYEVNDRLKFLIVTEILEEERAVAPVFFHTDRAAPLTFRNVDELNLDSDLSFTSNDLSIKTPRTNVQAQMVYKLSDHWTSQSVVSRGSANSDGYYTYIWPDVEGDNYFGQYFTYIKESRVTTDIQQNFNGDFMVGGMRNRVLIGLDYFSQQAVNNSLGYVFARNVTPQGGENFVDPASKNYPNDTLPSVYLSRASIDALLAGTAARNSKLQSDAYSAYVSDVINITPNITVLASLRADYFNAKAEISNPDDDFDQFTLSPKFGVVYQPVPEKVSIFANYQNAFYNSRPRTVYDADGNNPRVKTFKPEHANQWEVGVKSNILRDRLFATLSYYNIEISDRVITDANNRNDAIQIGKIASKGFEVDITANLFTGFSLIAGYSHNQVENLEGGPGDFYAEPGRVPGGQGPQDLVNFWATYKISSGALENLGFGLGGNYAGEHLVADNSLVGRFYLPAYTVLNASVFYNPDKFRFSVNVNNLTDEEYYSGYWSVNPQKPLNYTISMACRF